jgi:hypothetical protein
VTHIEEEVIGGRIENIVHGDRQFDHAEVRAKMAAGAGKRRDEFAAYFFRKLNELGKRQALYVCGGVYGVKNGRHAGRICYCLMPFCTAAFMLIGE